MNLIDPKSIPGMIEPIEQQNLFEVTKNLDLSGGEAIVEFGTFFGRSTCCILNGLLANPTLRPECRVVAYDGFKWPQNSRFAQYIEKCAKSGAVEALLDIDAPHIGFRRIFSHYLGVHEKAGILKTIECSLEESEWDGQSIKMMHIDSPHSYKDLKPILVRFFPHLVQGGRVIFQDFLYHWSSRIIAAVQVLNELGLLEYKYSVASSMVMEVREPPTIERIKELELAMERSDLAELIARAKKAVSGISIDRASIFLPRLDLAQVQYLWSAGRHHAATEVLIAAARANNPVSDSHLTDFVELMSAGFNIEREKS